MSRKLTQNVDTLSIASFATAPATAERGTVQGNAYKPCPWSQPLSCQATLHTCASFDVSCRAEG